MAESYEPTKGMKEEAERAIAWKDEGHAGGTRIGLIRARQIIRGENLSRDTVMRMFSFFSRHEKNKKAEGFFPGEDGYPSASRVAWGLWGGDAGFTWSSAIREQIINEAKKQGYTMQPIARLQTIKRSMDEDYHEDETYSQNDIWNVIVSTPEIDRYGTIIEPSGIDYTAYMSNPVVLAQHGADKFPVGKCLSLQLVEGNLEAQIQVECITEEGKNLNSLIGAGFVNAVSVGILPKTTEERTIGEDKVKAFTKSELIEFSIVSVPANRGALIKRDFKQLIQDSIQKYKEEKRMLTPEIEQKIQDELLPAIEEAVLTELTNLGFSQEEATSAVENMLSVGAEALVDALRGGEGLPDNQVVEPEAGEVVTESVESEASEDDEDEMDKDEEEEDVPVQQSAEATEQRIGKKIAARTEAQIEEGLSMIKRGYRMISLIRGKQHKNKMGSSLNPKNQAKHKIPDPVPFSYKAPVQKSNDIAPEMPVEKTTKELLELI